MENTIKKPYEISLWEDVLTFVYEDGHSTEEEVENGHGAVVAQYYKERKICVIGSDTMNTPIRAISPKLNPKINGSTELTFNLYSHYYDYQFEEYYQNPFIKLLTNERKIKVRYGALGADDTKWYDLVIKSVQENSENKTYEYVAKDLFINELSKSGFDIVLDSELENNMGNIDTLATVILDGSDWQLKKSEKVLEQFEEEPLYEIVLNQSIEAKDMKDDTKILSLKTGNIIYAFYSIMAEQKAYFQFLYADKYEIDDDHIIINGPENSNWYIDNVVYTENGYPYFSTHNPDISREYRGKRLVRKAKTFYDSTIDKYVSVYEDGKIYGYVETDYTSAAAVRSFITNGDMYKQEAGWEVGGDGNSFPEISFVNVPDIRDVPSEQIEDQDFKFCLKIENANKNNWSLYNSGLVDYRHYIDNIAKGEKYVCRLRCGIQSEAGEHGAKAIKYQNDGIEFLVGVYELVEGVYNIKETLFNGILGKADSEGFSYAICECSRALPYTEMIEMTKTLGFFLKFPGNNIYYLQDLQFFKYIQKTDGSILLPNELAPSEVKQIYCYYKPNKKYKSIDDVEFVYRDDEPNPAYKESFNDNTYEKIRSIKAEESNRFNLIQELCEIFECWPKFEIEHNEITGEILLDKDYHQKKYISFHEYIGKDNDRGFKYGINLKAIRRNIDSESIVSKLIVKNNANEFAQDGFCSIARANDNPSGENFILNFNYYIQQGMLNLSQITYDLYSNLNGSLGYYKRLKEINIKRDKYIIEQSSLMDDIAEYQSSYQTYEVSVAESKELEKEKLAFIISLTSLTFNELMANKENDWWENNEVIKTMAAIGRLKSIIAAHTILKDQAKTNLDLATARFESLNRILTSKEQPTKEQIDAGETERLLIDKEELHKAFYKKYSRFLQEGSWISEDYIDDNLYYLDAESTLHTSAFPKITYDINVLEISQIEGYENYIFSLGDKTTIEDTEFFGWTLKNGLQTPYKEEIVVTELILMLDEPDKNQVKVQNYKTQFEDLFQRMAATTQSVEYHTGEYTRASNIVETDGSINVVTIQNAMANNALTIQNAKDQSVVWDDTGITTTSLTSPAEIVRIVSGGIFLSKDGGRTWNTGITGRGINASHLTSGSINTDEILIMNGGYPSFRWDKTGISAYKFALNQQTGAPENFNYSQFVRLDQFGLYGISGHSNFNAAIKDEDGAVGENKIWKHSNFALTWKGFQIKSTHQGGGYISITSDKDFQVIDNEGKERVKLGLLYIDPNNSVYGISIKDSNEQPVMETNSDGTLWIKDKIYIGTEDTSKVTIGYHTAVDNNDSTVVIGYHAGKTNEKTGAHEVFHAGISKDQEFIVYEDGKMIASGAEFTGKIHATGGQIGNLYVEEIEDTIQQSKKLDIFSSLGYNFKVSEKEIFPTALKLEVTAIGFILQKTSIVWEGTVDFQSWETLATGTDTLNFSYEDFKEKQNSAYYIKASGLSDDDILYDTWVTIMSISDGAKGEKGESPVTMTIYSTNGNYFKNSTGSTTLIAKLYQDGQEIDSQGEQYIYTWKNGENSSVIYSGKELQVTADDVDFSKTYICEVTKGGS